MTAIEYCYIYNTSAGSGQSTFNWTVLILEDAGSDFVINRTYLIQSFGSMGSATCTSSGDYITCCDVTSTESFDLPMTFIFGVTESAQGNTHNAALLGFADALSQYRVGTLILPKGALNLSVGSSVLRSSLVPRGVRMLWFVIGNEVMQLFWLRYVVNVSITNFIHAGFTNTEQLSTTMSMSVETTDASTLPMPTDQEFSEPKIRKQENETTLATLISTASNPRLSVALIGTVIGGVAGSLLMLGLLLLLLTQVCRLTKKYKRAVNLLHQQEQPNQREAVQQQLQQHAGDEVLEMKSNFSITQQITVQDNIAYGQASPQVTTEDNVAYGQRECDNNLLSDQYEYDYI